MREKHGHNFLEGDPVVSRNQKKTLFVVVLTALVMVVEVITGYLSSSMALLADGWHMASHAAALIITYIAYELAKSDRLTDKFTFGAGKFIPLGGYTSAILLAVIAVWMGIESIHRFIAPRMIHFDQAIVVACLGLLVNIVSAFILSDFGHQEKERDHNIRGAYLHVLADALTSLFAIIALVVGKIFNVVWFDSLMGITGSVIILKWAYGLTLSSAWELLDGQAKSIDLEKVKEALEGEGARVTDLHVWRIAPKAHAAEIVVHAKNLRGSDYYRNILKEKFNITHATVEEWIRR